ncbi:MAG: NUDIX domain-containing protein [Bacillota bacterium]
MLVRNFVGGVVFSGDKVLLVKNDKNEWVLPREMMHDGELANEVALKKIREESGVPAEIVSPAGQTNYECSCITRQSPFCNKTTWYIMKSLNESENLPEDKNLKCGSFVKVEEAINLIEPNQDKSLINLSFRKYRELVHSVN